VVRVKTRPVEWEVFGPWGPKNCAVDTMGGRSRECVECSFCDRTSEVDKNWEGERWGLITGFQQRLARGAGGKGAKGEGRGWGPTGA